MRSRVATVASATVLVAAAAGAAGVARWRRGHVHDGPSVPASTLPGTSTVVTSADGTRLAAQVVRPERPRAAVVLTHGWTMGMRFWHHQLRELAADGIHVVAYDQRGHGRSEPAATGDYGSTVLAIDLDTIVHELVPEDLPLSVVGHSMGAMSVVAWATHPAARGRDRLCGAVLCNTGVHQLLPSMSPLVPSWLPDGVLTQILTSPLPLPRKTNRILRQLVRQIAHGPDAPAEAVELTEQLFLDCPADVRAAFGSTLARLDLRHAVGHLTVPTVVVGGHYDRMTPMRHARDLVAGLTDAELVELPRAGHQSPLDEPDRVTDVIRTHLAATCAVAV